MNQYLQTAPDPDQLADRLARFICETINRRLSEKDRFFLALSGGSTPQLLFKLIAEKYPLACEWEKVHFFWVDERCVPHTDPQSNFGACKDLMLDHLDCPPEHIHPVDGSREAEKEALRYASDLLAHIPAQDGIPLFDLVLLGIGTDGHTASIFPNSLTLFHAPQPCVATQHPESRQKRISITGTVINKASCVVFVVAGEEKKEVLFHIVTKNAAFEHLPAALVKPENGELYFFADQSAASLL